MRPKKRLARIREKREKRHDLNLKARANFLQVLIVISGLLITFGVSVFSNSSVQYEANATVDSIGNHLRGETFYLGTLFFFFLFFAIFYYMYSFILNYSTLTAFFSIFPSLSFSCLVVYFLVGVLNINYSIKEILFMIVLLSLTLTLCFVPLSVMDNIRLFVFRLIRKSINSIQKLFDK
jgi:hypothetical protein